MRLCRLVKLRELDLERCSTCFLNHCTPGDGSSQAPALTRCRFRLMRCAQVSAGAGVALPGLARASQLGRLADLQDLDLQGAGTTDAFLADLATAAPRLTRWNSHVALQGKDRVPSSRKRAS